MERVLGYYGGQMASFEAVFSQRGPDGQPRPLFDRETGRIDPSVQKAWERYDISAILRQEWPQLGTALLAVLLLVALVCGLLSHNVAYVDAPSASFASAEVSTTDVASMTSRLFSICFLSRSYSARVITEGTYRAASRSLDR
jgi:hypothetical protein